jgi:hypothetical protein
MAWNPSPKVADARELARKHGANKVIVLLVDERRGTLESISYGEDRRQCAEAKRLADAAYDAVMDQFARATPTESED